MVVEGGYWPKLQVMVLFSNIVPRFEESPYRLSIFSGSSRLHRCSRRRPIIQSKDPVGNEGSTDAKYDSILEVYPLLPLSHHRLGSRFTCSTGGGVRGCERFDWGRHSGGNRTDYQNGSDNPFDDFVE